MSLQFRAFSRSPATSVKKKDHHSHIVESEGLVYTLREKTVRQIPAGQVLANVRQRLHDLGYPSLQIPIDWKNHIQSIQHELTCKEVSEMSELCFADTCIHNAHSFLLK